MGRALGFAEAKWVLTALALALGLSACGSISSIPALEERAMLAWSEVQNQHRRRADLIPNLVETLKGSAQQEREVLARVMDARTKATQVQVDASTIVDPQRFREFQDAQDQLSVALGRLLATVERYPELKANASFLAAKAELEGTENRIAVARRDYVDIVRAYNRELRKIPDRWIAAIMHPEARPMETFAASAGSASPPPARF